jgi:hypothetical protein
MAFRKSRRLRRNLRKSRKNRNRYYRGGGPEEIAGTILQKFPDPSDPSFQSNVITEIKSLTRDQDMQAKIAGNIIFKLKLAKSDISNFPSLIKMRDF